MDKRHNMNAATVLILVTWSSDMVTSTQMKPLISVKIPESDFALETTYHTRSPVQ